MLDDEDFGEVIVYTGQGGNDPTSGRQVADQSLERGNMGLAISSDQGFPVRVARGAGGDAAFSPASGYRYDGIFFVAEYWSEVGKSGHRVWRFRLVKDQAPEPENPPGGPAPEGNRDSRYSTVQRVVRNTAVTQWVKERYGFACQICGQRIETSSGLYAEGGHIRPRGRPHDGPDSVENVLCLCPNDHVRLDRGVLVISDDLHVIERATDRVIARLRLVPEHRPAARHLTYQRELWEG